MKMLKMLFAAAAAVTMTFTAQAAKTAKAVLADSGKTLKFVYDDVPPSGAKGTDWFSVSEVDEAMWDAPQNAKPWCPYYHPALEGVETIVIDDSFADYTPRDCGAWFSWFPALKAVQGIRNLNLSQAQTVECLFCGCTGLEEIDLCGLDMSHITSTDDMFFGCEKLRTIVADFDLSSVTTMDNMFGACESLERISVTSAFKMPNVNPSWDAVFFWCTNLVGGAGTAYNGAWTSGLYARIDGGVSAPGYFTVQDAPKPPLLAKAVVEDGGKTLRFVYDSVDYDLQGKTWYSLADYEETRPNNPEWHAHCGTVTNAVFDPSFAVCKPETCDRWFYEFTQLVGVEGLENLDTAKVTDMDSMFEGCSSLTQLNLSGFDTAKVTGMAYMFCGCSSLEAICASDRFVTDQVSDSDNMFQSCSKLVGGAGTAYDPAKTDREYARIDGKDGQPGYFTRGQMTIATGAYASLDLVDDLGIEIPDDVDYAAGDKVTIKVEGLAKGLKVVATPVYEDPNAKKKVIVDYVYTIEGVPTEAVDFETRPMYARVTTTYKDKTKGDKGKVETLQPIVLSITTPEPSVLTAGVLGQEYGPFDVTNLWSDVGTSKEWTFKGWPAGLKYANGVVSGQPTKAGEFPITATWKHKLDDNKTTVSETFSAVLTVWGDDGATDFCYVDQAYVETATKALDATWKSFSGLPTGIKYTTKLIAADTKKGTPEYPAYSLYGTPTKAGVFAVTATKVDPDDAKKTVKETFLWKVDPPDAPEFALDTDTAPVEDLKAQIVQGANQTFAIAASEGAKVTVTGLPTGLKLVQDKTTGLYSVEGVATKPGEYFVTFKTVLNGVTTVTTTAFTVKANPFVATYRGYAYARPDVRAAYRLAVAEVTVAAAGTVKLTYTEGKTKYTASVKSFTWDDATGKGTAEGLVLKVSSADKKLGYGDRKATVTFEDRGAYLKAKLSIADANGTGLSSGVPPLFETVNTTEVPLPASQTFVFRALDGGPLATVSVAYDAKKATAAFSGKLYDGTAVKATIPVTRWDDDGDSADYVFAPFLVISKDGTVYCFDGFSSGLGFVDVVDETGELPNNVCVDSVNYTLGDKKFAELVPETGAFTFGWGSDAGIVGADAESFAFEVTTDAKGNPAGVTIYDVDLQEDEKPLATVTAKVGKTTGAISVSFTSKKGDKAKYAVELAWQGEKLFAGHVTRTWKGVVDNKSVNFTAYGTAEVK